jgi:ferredoxin/flavodoxin
MAATLHTLFFSPTGGTARIVEEVAAGLGGGAAVHDLTLPGGRERDLAFDPEDVVVVGVPVYAGRVPVLAAQYLDRVQGRGALAVLVAVYGNRAFEDALLELRDLCQARGFRCLAAAAFVAEHSYTGEVAAGRPDPADLAAARAFGAGAAGKLARHPGGAGLSRLEVPGNVPYRDRPPRMPMAPETSDRCVACLACADRCPAGAIVRYDPHQVDADRCIRCSACVKRCPTGAKSFSHPFYLNMRAILSANLAQLRREPEYFY